MANIFEKLQDAQFQAEITPRTKESTEWLRNKVQRMSRLGGMRVINDLEETNTVDLGSMVMFNYRADKGTVIRKIDKIGSRSGLKRSQGFSKRRKEGVANVLHPGFYDAFPVILVLDIYDRNDKYLEGINLHYLAPLERARILNEILEHTKEDQFDPVHLFKTLGSMSKGGKVYNHPGFKVYNFTNIMSKIVQIKQDEWEIATFLPTSEFVSDYIRGPYGLADGPPSKQQVYQWSRRKLR